MVSIIFPDVCRAQVEYGARFTQEKQKYPASPKSRSNRLTRNAREVFHAFLEERGIGRAP